MAIPLLAKFLSLGRIALNMKTLSNLVRDVSGITKEIRDVRRAGVEADTAEGDINVRFSELEKELSLQAELNGKLAEQIESVRTVLEGFQRSVKVLMYTVYLLAAVSVAAVLIAAVR